MTDDKKKPMTGAEFRKAQEEQELKARVDEAAKRATADQKRLADKEAALTKLADDLVANWFSLVQAAGKHEGVRFLVLAKVAAERMKTPQILKVLASIEAQEFEHATLSYPHDGRGPFKNAMQHEEGIWDSASGVQGVGWVPKDLPDLTAADLSSYSSRLLIVKW